MSVPQVHLSDAVRVALLWKYGGTYLDLDTVTIRPFLHLYDNFIGLQVRERS